MLNVPIIQLMDGEPHLRCKSEGLLDEMKVALTETRQPITAGMLHKYWDNDVQHAASA